MRDLLLTNLIVFSFLISKAQDTELQKLWKKYQKGKYEQVLKEGKILLKEDTQNIEYNHLVGRAYFSKGDIDSAIIFLEKAALTDDPKSSAKAWGYNFLGKCYLNKNDFTTAEEYFYKSFSMHATKNVTNSSYQHSVFNGLLKYYDNWTSIETEHYVFYFQNPIGAKEFAQSREKAYDYISEYLGVDLDEKIRYVVWTVREDACKVINMNIGFSKPSIYLIHSKLTQTPGHEITHVISHYITDIKYKTGLINEGIAVYLDLDDKDEMSIVKQAMEKYKMDNISIKSFWNNWQKYNEDISYAVAGLFVGELINKYGKDKFLEFFVDQSYDHAKQVFGSDLDEFIKKFESNFDKI